ncbi:MULTISPECIES: SMI1/KNR4 family protein [Streptacidiphilus]|uniref:SMI1/KNR4 family protein n=1 Tax=Streptacidiphilus cavernicola TaxID=3342716 RepID=A0ABV6UJM2_9ACTN|nr:SMI1/KNR4 family protein [Streptacidiphilus jeojiense]
MDREMWRPFLEQWSGEWIAGRDPDRDAPLDEEVVRDAWLGFGPASEAELAAAEARLGRRLPPSLREFLLVTNGWRDAGNFIYRLAGTTELDWLRDTDDRTWIDAWEDLVEDEDEDDEEENGVEEDPTAHEARVLARSLRLSLEGDAAVMLLDPEDVDEQGEWAAYWLASWSGRGPERCNSFVDLMQRQWMSFHALRRPPGATRDHWDAEVERARQEALTGEVDAPLEVFARAHAFGRDRADVLSLQMKMLLGDWRRHIAGTLWYRPHLDDLLLGPLFATELLPLLLRHDQLAAPHDLRPLPRLKEHAPEPVRALIADYEARAAEPGFRLSFGAPDFDAAVHTVTDRPGDDAWPDLLTALQLWRPVDDDHIAPVSLLADPILAQLITPDRGRQILTTPRPRPRESR